MTPFTTRGVFPEAQAVTPNFAQWEIVLSVLKVGSQALGEYAEDTARNVEKRGHRIVVK